MIFILSIAAFLLYLSVIMAHRISAVRLKKNYIKIFLLELLVCGVFLALALDLRFGFFAGTALRAALVCLSAGMLLLFGKIVAGCFLRTAGEAKRVIVLGLALENGKPTRDLLSRVETARRYAAAHPDAVLILTGGNPDAAGKTEAAVMRDLLMERGVPQAHMRLEDQAETTIENFENTARMLDPAQPVVLISSNYHMDRAVQTAKRAGFTRVLRLPAPSSPVQFCANVLWEAVLEIHDGLAQKR